MTTPVFMSGSYALQFNAILLSGAAASREVLHQF
jgi:hypothetical protein